MTVMTAVVTALTAFHLLCSKFCPFTEIRIVEQHQQLGPIDFKDMHQEAHACKYYR